MQFNVWTLVVDVGIISILLMLGKFLRTRVRIIQKLFLPPSLIAGFAALILGPELLGWLPLSDNSGTYSSILIAFVFACIPLTSKKGSASANEGIGRMWVYSNAGMLLQWSFGAILGVVLFSRIWNVDKAFGIAMPAGFCGGHGTAAAMGDAFALCGFEDMFSLAMTCATVGIIAAVIVGLAMIKWGTRHSKTAFLSDYENLPEELRTGIVPKDKRDSMGDASFSAISLDSLTFNFGTIAVCSVCGYYISRLVSHYFPSLIFPVFICAFLVALVVRKLFEKTGVIEHISPKIIGHLSGSFTDYLVAFGVASIKLAVVWEYIVPILILIFVGLALTFLYVYFVGKRISGDYWFEKAVFSWGWFTGTMSMSIALLRIVDPDMKSACLDEYAYAYIYVAPVEIALISLAPIAFSSGLAWLYIGLSLAGAVASFVIAGKKGYLKKKI